MATSPPIRAEPLLILVRGLPGSGKSTLAKALRDKYGMYHYEADFYMVNQNSQYEFDARRLNYVHEMCYTNARIALLENTNTVVSNTFTTRWELDRYLSLGYNTLVLKCVGEYGNVHNVPSESITRMKNRWENYEGEIEVSADWPELLGELKVRQDSC